MIVFVYKRDARVAQSSTGSSCRHTVILRRVFVVVVWWRTWRAWRWIEQWFTGGIHGGGGRQTTGARSWWVAEQSRRRRSITGQSTSSRTAHSDTRWRWRQTSCITWPHKTTSGCRESVFVVEDWRQTDDSFWTRRRPSLYVCTNWTGTACVSSMDLELQRSYRHGGWSSVRTGRRLWRARSSSRRMAGDGLQLGVNHLFNDLQRLRKSFDWVFDVARNDDVCGVSSDVEGTARWTANSLSLSSSSLSSSGRWARNKLVVSARLSAFLQDCTDNARLRQFSDTVPVSWCSTPSRSMWLDFSLTSVHCT